MVANISTADQITAAYCAALDISSDIIVEQYITGEDYRVLVVGDKVVAAAKREPAHVIGDGVSTIQELIDKANQDPRRGTGHGNVLTKISIDEIGAAVLSDQGFSARSVPPAGMKVLIRRNANLSTGGTAEDVTDKLHPDFSARCVEAARVIGLDVAGIDVIAKDITQPLTSENGGIVEINAAPGLRMHLSPSSGQPRAVGEAIMDLLYNAGENGRIPIAAVTGVNGKTTVTRLIAHALRTTGKNVGMTCTDGIWINERRIDTGDCSGPRSAQAVLAHPDVEMAVLETARGGILRAGLGFDHCDVAVVTNIGEGDHLGIDGIDTLEKLAQVKRTIVDVVFPNGLAVLNAADPLVYPMKDKCPGRSLLFAISENEPSLVQHRQLNLPVSFIRNGYIVIAEADREFVIDQLKNIPITLEGQIRFQVENVMAAASALWALGVSLEDIRKGLRSFQSDANHSPGRFNIMSINGATVIVDYGHNPSALEALIQAVSQLSSNCRSVVYSTAGDRRNCDIERQGELLGNHFDTVYLYEGHYKRGRSDGELLGLFKAGLAKGTRSKRTLAADHPLVAAEMALNELKPGDLLLIQADKVDETVEFLNKYVSGKCSSLTMRVDTTETASPALTEGNHLPVINVPIPTVLKLPSIASLSNSLMSH